MKDHFKFLAQNLAVRDFFVSSLTVSSFVVKVFDFNEVS